jgi:hypothetical protein
MIDQANLDAAKAAALAAKPPQTAPQDSLVERLDQIELQGVTNEEHLLLNVEHMTKIEEKIDRIERLLNVQHQMIGLLIERLLPPEPVKRIPAPHPQTPDMNALYNAALQQGRQHRLYRNGCEPVEDEEPQF